MYLYLMNSPWRTIDWLIAKIKLSDWLIAKIKLSDLLIAK
jgi:hypothetical protein